MKRNTLTTAVLAGLTGMAGMVSVSNAVNVNPDGLGQVLLYPYYTARGENDTLVSIVNTTDRGKAVKIRFIEALNSREVLDFNIYMSPFDVWVGGITATEDGGGKVIVPDTTCTVPYIHEFAGSEQNFLDFEYTGDKADGGPDGIERTASGYIEVIEMGTMVETPEIAPATTDPSYIPYASKHLGGVPNDCQHFIDQWTFNIDGEANPADSNDLQWISNDTAHGFDADGYYSGGLYGGASIINVDQGTMFTYNATAIDGFWGTDDDPTISHQNPGNLNPDLSSSSEFVSNVFVNGQVVSHDWLNGTPAQDVAAVNAVLTHEMVMNEYVTASELFANTEWVLTFPTKHFHTRNVTTAIAPFQDAWDDEEWACENFNFTTPTEFEDYYVTGGSRAFDREERPDVDPPEGQDPVPPIVSPRPPSDDPEEPEPDYFQLCREANIIRFSSDGETPPEASEIFGEPWREGNGLGYSNFGLQFENGWVRLDLAEIAGSTARRVSTPGINTGTSASEAVEGLPVIGFSANAYVNEALEGATVRANYAGTFNHRGTRSVVSAD